MAASFFTPTGPERYRATDYTRGPWDPQFQHAGPPSGLLARALERLPDGDGKRVGRVTCEILGPIPVAEFEVAARVLRPGRRVDLVEAGLRADGKEVMLARGWRFPDADVALPFPADHDPPPPGPDQGREVPFFDVAHSDGLGYHRGMEWRFVTGGFRESGDAVAWLRMAVPLLPDEEPSPLVRVLVAADSGNGVSGRMDPREHLFINTDLTVHLHRLPVGEWVCLDAHTVLNGTAVGLTETGLSDEQGRIGRALQTLLVAPR